MENLKALTSVVHWLVAKVEQIPDSKDTMNTETKLQEMCDRGWHFKMSRQKSSDTWDLVGALYSRLLREEQTFSTYGKHTSLFDALLDLEQMLLKDSAL